MTAPFAHDGSTAGLAAFAAGVCALRAEGYAATVGSAAELAAYGLDDPVRLVAVLADGTLRDVQLGADAGAGQVYARLDATGDVYRLGREQLDFLYETELAGLLDPFVALVSVQDLAELTVAGPEGAVRLSADAAAGRYAIDGQAVTAADFSQIYGALIGVMFDKLAPETAQAGELLLSLRFSLQDGTVRTANYYDHDAFYALARTSGGGSFLLRRTRLAEALAMQKEEQP